MLTPGQLVDVSIEKPAAGGRMLARHEGQVVFVLGAIPGERVRVRIDRVERQLAFATTVAVIEPSASRREPFVDPSCGGCLYAHITYAVQPEIKAAVIQDAFARLGRISLDRVEVMASPETGYRMRGRLHVRGTEAGFYREGTRDLCDAAATRQLRPEAIESAIRTVRDLHAAGAVVDSIQISENIAGDERAFHIELASGSRLHEDVRGERAEDGVTGWSVHQDSSTVAVGTPVVADSLAVLTSGRAGHGSLARSASSFFQANRYLVPHLVAAVLDAVPAEGSVLDLYAGVGLFSMALASTGRTRITAVEGDRSSGNDLRRNAAQFPDRIRVRIDSVERYLTASARRADTVIVDPPRTGISKRAMQAVAALGAERVVYVSCDPPTMARDARRLLEAGYRIESVRAFDLFPNTPHVETLGVFVRS